MSNWKPLGKFVLVKLHTRGSTLTLDGTDLQYNGLGTVLAIGADVDNIVVGDVVLLNGPQGIIAHKEFGEDVGLVAGPLVLAKRVETVDAVVVSH